MEVSEYDAIIVNYGMGNLGSILNMMKRVGATALISSSPDDIAKARRLILPGVGAFDNGMKNLADMNLIPILNRKALEDKVPVLGICLGMQLLSEKSEEGDLPGLSWVQGEFVKFQATQKMCVPHMGWNTASIRQKSSVLFDTTDYQQELRYYFVHSYYMKCAQAENVLMTTNYLGVEFVSGVQKGNILGVQFHPEKSHRFGMNLFTNFLKGTASKSLQ